MTTFYLEKNFGDEVLFVSNIIERYENLRVSKEDVDEDWGETDSKEFDLLQVFLNDLSGSGHEIQWNESDYPAVLIKEAYLPAYLRQYYYAVTAGADPSDWKAHWVRNFTDWTEAAAQAKRDCEYLAVTMESLDGQQALYYFAG